MSPLIRLPRREWNASSGACDYLAEGSEPDREEMQRIIETPDDVGPSKNPTEQESVPAAPTPPANKGDPEGNVASPPSSLETPLLSGSPVAY